MRVRVFVPYVARTYEAAASHCSMARWPFSLQHAAKAAASELPVCDIITVKKSYRSMWHAVIRVVSRGIKCHIVISCDFICYHVVSIMRHHVIRL